MKPVVYDPGSGFGLERTPSGHIQTPLWTYDCKGEMQDGKFQYTIGGRFHQIKAQAMQAFLCVLNGPRYSMLNEDDILCHQTPMDANGEVFWRLRTVAPAELPKPRKSNPTALPVPSLPAIDV